MGKETDCLKCQHCRPYKVECTNPRFKAKWNLKAICPGYVEGDDKWKYLNRFGHYSSGLATTRR